MFTPQDDQLFASAEADFTDSDLYHFSFEQQELAPVPWDEPAVILVDDDEDHCKREFSEGYGGLTSTYNKTRGHIPITEDHEEKCKNELETPPPAMNRALTVCSSLSDNIVIDSTLSMGSGKTNKPSASSLMLRKILAEFQWFARKQQRIDDGARLRPGPGRRRK